MIVPLLLLELEKYDNTISQQNAEITYWDEIFKDILPEYVGV